MIKQEIIRDILEIARIEEVVGEFVSLKRRGTNMVGLCPFHNEKTPSFYVSPTKHIYKCFGCGKAGDVVSFIREHEHFTYPEALKYLAKKYNIPIEEEEVTEEVSRQQDEKESLYLVSTYAQVFFTEALFNTEEGKAIGLTYFKERGFREDIIKKFQLGYSADVWDGFTREAVKKENRLEYLVKTGLTIEGEGKYYDRFRGRVMFPIHNLTGRVIGFGGRILSSDKSKAKYVNSPESDIYSKSKVLYGLYFAKNDIITNDNCLLVEGYTDVISLHQAGIQNVVSSSGTSLTQDQIRLISRYSKNITMLYDGDEAGIKASFRGLDMILEQGLKVRIVLFPDGEDPDSFARKNRTAEVKEFISKNAVDFIIFKTSLLLKEAKQDPVKRVDVLRDIIHTIALIPDGLDRIAYIKQSSDLLDVSEQAIMFQVNKARQEKASGPQSSGNAANLPQPAFTSEPQNDGLEINPTESHEREILRIILNYGKQDLTIISNENPDFPEEIKIPVFQYIADHLAQDEITLESPVFSKVFEEYLLVANDKNIIADNYFISHADGIIRNVAIDLLSNVYDTSPNWQNSHQIYVPKETDLESMLVLTHNITQTLSSYKLQKVINKIASLKKEMKENMDRYEDIQSEIIKYTKIKKELSQILGRVIS